MLCHVENKKMIVNCKKIQLLNAEENKKKETLHVLKFLDILDYSYNESNIIFFLKNLRWFIFFAYF